MLDFVVEARPRSLKITKESPSGFVAEVRPSSRHHVGSLSPVCRDLTNQTETTDIKTVETKDKVESDLNDILFKKSVSIDKLTNVMHSSFVTLVKTLLVGYNISGIKGSVHVSLADCNETIRINLNEDYENNKDSGEKQTPRMELLGGLKYKIKNAPCCEESSNSMEFAPLCNFGASPPYRSQEASSAQSSPIDVLGHQPFATQLQETDNMDTTSDKMEADEESGYSSSGRESVHADLEKGDQNADDTRTNSCSNGLDSGVVENKSEIDEVTKENSKLELESGIEAENTDVDNVSKLSPTISHNQTKDAVFKRPRIKTRFIDMEKGISSSSESEMTTGESSVHESSSETETDAPMGLPGDCETNVDAASVDGESPSGPAVTKLNKIVPCKKCPGTLLDYSTYEKHSLEKHQTYVCVICMKEFSSKNNLKRHVRIHTGSRPYKCNQCEMSFARKDDLKGHTLKHDFSKPFRCSICKKGYTDRACVKNHMLKEHCSRYMKICPQCGESFDREELFLEHKKTHSSLKQFACETCPFIGTNHLMALKHTLLHTHKLFSCKPCNAYFSNPFDYTKHIRKHKKTPTFTKYVCCFCDITLPTYEQFVRHEYSHAQGKLNECGVCKKQFKSKSSMNEHMLSHNNTTNALDVDMAVALANYDDSSSKTTEQTGLIQKVLDTQHQHNTDLQATRPAEIVEPASPYQHIDSPIAMDENFEGELLDLTVKRPSSTKESPHQSFSDERNAMLSSKRTSLSKHSVPRNGCTAIDTRFNEPANQTPPNFLYNDVKRSSPNTDPEYRTTWHNSNGMIPVDRERGNMNLPSNDILPSKPPPLVKAYDYIVVQNTDGAEKQHQGFDNGRVHPYNNMVNFASKYLVARGNKIKSRLFKKVSDRHGSNHIVNNDQLIFNKQHQESTAQYSTRIENENIKYSQYNVSCYQNKDLSRVNKMDNITGFSQKSYTPLERNDQLTGMPIQSPSPVFNQKQHSYKMFTTLPRPQPNSPDSSEVNCKTFKPENTQWSKESSSKKEISKCDICQQDFESFYHLESHSVINHNRYLCEFCGKSFTARPNRDRHVRYHTGERPYKCELCPSAFFRGDDLKYHRTTRHPMEQINCNRCSATFTWKKDLERHLRHSKCVV